MMEETNLTNGNKNNIGSKMPVVDYESVEFSNQELELHSSTNFGEIPNCGSMDNLFDELLKDTHNCTHFHTCNPPGPDFPHTHTCVHMHTKLVNPSSNNDGQNNDDFAESKETNGRKRGWDRGGSNREAVRKYRQKKKAYTTSLANELVSLRAVNQQLMQRLQHHVSLETEVARLKCLLVDIRGRIEGEIGSFPYQNTVASRDLYQNVGNGSFPISCKIPCNVGCGGDGKAGKGCEFQNVNCMASIASPPSFT